MFGPDGFLPSGRISLSHDELYERFVATFPGSPTRARLFESWMLHRSEAAELLSIREQWIGGSFSTDRIDPPDIDVVTFFDGPEFDLLSPGRRRLAERLFEGHKTRDERGIDAFSVSYYPESHPAWGRFVAARGYWDVYFSRLKYDHDSPRGYLEVRDDIS